VYIIFRMRDLIHQLAQQLEDMVKQQGKLTVLILPDTVHQWLISETY
jgi:hypothetical protein